MKSIISVLIFTALSIASCLAEDSPKLEFKEQGFSIAPLDTQPAAGMALVMKLPAVDGFAANVNVMLQNYKDSLDEYLELSKKQFDAMKFTVVKADVTKTGVTFEYTGEQNERALHWYAKATKKGDFIYIATATATEEQWKDVSEKLIKCVNSFEAK